MVDRVTKMTDDRPPEGATLLLVGGTSPARADRTLGSVFGDVYHTLPQLDLFLLVQWVGDDPATRHPFAASEAGHRSRRSVSCLTSAED